MKTGIHYSVFTKDEFHYCVPIEHVREVIRTKNLILTPMEENGFIGYLDFRNALCPVLDIRKILLTKQPERLEGPFNLMVLEYDSSLFAILIDRFVESLGHDDEGQENVMANEREKLLVDKVYRYNGMALNRINLQFIKSFILANIKSNLQLQAAVQSSITNPSDETDEIEMICFRIGHLLFGIPITDLIEVIEGYSVEPLFRVNSFLRGLINLRGQIIACVDISGAIGLPPRKMEEKNQYILLQDDNRDLALCIDVISKKQKYKQSQIQSAESIFSGELIDYLLGIIEAEPERIFVISGPKIFASKHLVPYQE